MRISPIMSYNFQHHPQKNNKKNIVFKGEYSDWIEEIAYKRGFITKEQLVELAQPLLKTAYGKYLIEISEGL